MITTIAGGTLGMDGLVSQLRQKLAMMRRDALAVAKVVEQAFRGEGSVEDETLDLPTRQLFYDLQDAQVLKLLRREVVEDGDVRRHYQWTMDDSPKPTPLRPHQPISSPEAELYAQLGEEAWNRRKTRES